MTEKNTSWTEIIGGGVIVFGALFGIVALGLGYGLWATYVLLKVYAWFIVPYFHGPLVSFWQFYGAMLLVHAIRYSLKTDRKKEEEVLGKRKIGGLITNITFGPLFTLLAAYCVHRWLL